jgi:hypothetical protein
MQRSINLALALKIKLLIQQSVCLHMSHLFELWLDWLPAEAEALHNACVGIAGATRFSILSLRGQAGTDTASQVGSKQCISAHSMLLCLQLSACK